MSKISPAFLGYLKAQEDAEQIHGDKTMVMMQMGSFLEMFHIHFEDGTELGKAEELSDVLNKMGEKKDQVGKQYNGKTISNVSRYGFPFLNESKERYVSIANKRGYTVPVYYQKGSEKDPITKIVPRFLGDTWTPTIRPNSTTEGFNEWFVGYLVSSTISICAVNPHTRTFKTCEFPNSKTHIPESCDFLRMNRPTEVVIWTTKSEYPNLGIPDNVPVRVLEIGNARIDSQIRSSVMELVSKEYVIANDIPDITVRVFDFMMSTVPDVMKETSYHQICTDYTHTMTLENHCLSQLNIIDTRENPNVSKKDRSVIGVVNHTVTHMGERTLMNWITNPSIHKSTIDRRTGLGQFLQTATHWENGLKGMVDLDRLFSSEILGGLKYTLLTGCVSTIQRFIELDQLQPLLYNEHRFPVPVEESINFIQEIKNSLVPSESLPYNGRTVGGGDLSMYGEPCEIEFPFTRECVDKIGSGSGSDVWNLYQEYISYLNILKQMETDLDVELSYVNHTHVLWVKGGKKGVVRERGSYWENASKIESKHSKGRFEISPDTQIHTERLDAFITRMNQTREKLKEQTCELWFVWSRGIRKTYEHLVSQVSQLIGEVDVALSGVKCVRKYGYSYANVTESSSFYNVMGLRHPLIESIQQNVGYVPHTLTITETKRGRLLFGVNSSGKSSLMKAIGISIVLAQAGLPVPAQSLTLGIYHSLFTRIIGNDNLFQGMSTFAVEASELLRIMKTSNDRSMVLGDELCSGTEQYGAEAIVASSILTLLKRNVSCVFATHWHRLRDLPDLCSHPKLVWNHLRVDCDEHGRMIMYRTLEDGPGPRGYAIEYLKNMGADEEMIEEAIRIRSRITSEDFAIRSARSWNQGGETTSWNSKAKVDSKCQICNERNREETDHIIPRECANQSGGLDGKGSIHHGGNLVGLCKDCHNKKTRGLIHIYGFKEVLGKNGIQEKILEWEYTKNERISVDNPMCDLIRRFSASGSTIRQIQGTMKRNGYKVSQSFIRETLSDTK